MAALGYSGREKASLVAALTQFGLIDQIPAEKDEWRQLAIRGGLAPTRNEWLMDYCQQDVDATATLLCAMSPIDWPRALLRGHTVDIAAIERRGIPMDTGMLQAWREGGMLSCWTDPFKDRLCTLMAYSVGNAGPICWRATTLVERSMTGKADDEDVSANRPRRTQCRSHHELRATFLAQLNSLAVGSMAVERCSLLRPATGRPTQQQFYWP